MSEFGVTFGQGYVNVDGAFVVVSRVATVVTCIMLGFEPVMSSMLVWVHCPVLSGVQRISQLVPTSPAGGVRGVGCPKIASGVTATKTEKIAIERIVKKRDKSLRERGYKRMI